ncbi:MAG: hypothetical protein CMD96_02595, partial [Gammaproteobacteria bacterium]|nr:hypothetical protein [Gammaproteobacteria bacterium]
MAETLKLLLDYPKKINLIYLHLAILSAVTIFLLIPFADKAFHIDDPLFLDLGKFYFDGINSYYLKPYYYYGIRYENALNSSHSPLGLPPLNFIIYYLFDNPDEKVFHLIYLIFPASVSVFTYLFFLRFSKSPFILSLLLLLTPPFIVLSSNIMTDICFYSFLMGSFIFYISGVDKKSCKLVLVSMILFSISIAISYQSIVFYPLFFLYSYLKDRNNLKYFFFMPASLLPVLFWYAYHYAIVGDLPNPFSEKLPFELDRVLALKLKTVYYLSNLGLSFLSPVIFIVYGWQKRLMPVYLFSFAFSLILFISVNDSIFAGYSINQKIVLLASFAFGIFMILSILYQFTDSIEKRPEKQDTLFLAIWFLFFFAVCILFTPFGANRYLFPLIPPLLILLANKIKFNKLIYMYLLLMIVFSLRTATADYNYANSYKSFARDVKNKVSSVGTIWFTGEWGFRHYMTEEGYKYLTFDSKLKKNDLIIKPELNVPMDLDKRDILLNFEKDFRIDSREKLKVLSVKSNAGFYSHGFGLLPFWFDDNPLEHFEVYKVILPNLVRTAEQIEHETTVGEITKNNIIGQTFISDVNHLSVIKVFIASYNRRISQEIIFHLRNAEDSSEDIVKVVLPASKIKDNS